MPVIILAAGNQIRWNRNIHKLPKYKQLVCVDKVPIIVSIQKRTVDPIVVTKCKAIEKVSENIYRPTAHRWIVETLYNTLFMWSARTIVLLGDVYYTDKAIEMIKTFTGDIGFFGNKTDILALSFNSDKRYEVAIACKRLIDRKGNCKLWHLYRYMHDIPLYRHEITTDFIKITDETRDFDNPMQYVKFCRSRKK